MLYECAFETSETCNSYPVQSLGPVSYARWNDIRGCEAKTTTYTEEYNIFGI